MKKSAIDGLKKQWVLIGSFAVAALVIAIAVVVFGQPSLLFTTIETPSPPPLPTQTCGFGGDSCDVEGPPTTIDGEFEECCDPLECIISREGDEWISFCGISPSPSPNPCTDPDNPNPCHDASGNVVGCCSDEKPDCEQQPSGSFKCVTPTPSPSPSPQASTCQNPVTGNTVDCSNQGGNTQCCDGVCISPTATCCGLDLNNNVQVCENNGTCCSSGDCCPEEFPFCVDSGGCSKTLPSPIVV